MSGIEDTIGWLLIRTMRAHRNCAQEVLGRIGLFPGQELILLELGDQEGLTQTQIAERLGIEAPTVTKMLQRLERAGLVVRMVDIEDARVSRVSLTPESRALVPQVREAWRQLESRTLHGLNETEQVLLRRLILQMRQNLEEC